MNQHERNSLDRYITGNYGEDQFRNEDDGHPDYPDQSSLFGLVRNTDPDTSKQAAAKVDVKKTEYLVLIAIRDSGSHGCIAAELPDLTGLPLNSASARTRPLANKGLIRDSGERRQGPNGRNQIVWKAVLSA